MIETNERGTKTLLSLSVFNRTIELRYKWIKYYKEDIATGKKFYWNGKPDQIIKGDK